MLLRSTIMLCYFMIIQYTILIYDSGRKRTDRLYPSLSLQLTCAAIIGVIVAWCQCGAEVWLQSHHGHSDGTTRYSFGGELWMRRQRNVVTQNTATTKDVKEVDAGDQYNSRVRRCRYGAVAADSEVCSRIGTDILALKNGSAADAAIAAILCVGVVNMHSISIGGGSITLAYDRKSGTMTSIDSLAVAPIASSPNMFLNSPMGADKGAQSIAVPGDIAGYWRLHQLYGRLPWKDLFEPTIRLCEEGMIIEGALHRAIKNIKSHLYLFPSLHALVTNETLWVKLKKGEKMLRPKYAQTLRRIAFAGGSDFYTGSLADDVIADLSEAGSIITKDDLRAYKVKEHKPLKFEVGGYDVFTPTTPSGGPVVQYLLSILKGYNLENIKQRLDPTLGSLDYHRIAEAMKFAFAKRTELSDADYVDVTKILNHMRDKGESVRQRILDETTQDESNYKVKFSISDDNGTSHLSVLDKDGNAVSITSSINVWFGSYVMGERTGILFNAGMDDFGIPGALNHYNMSASPVNFISPGKRAVSSMTPVIALDKTGDVKLVTGAAGGPLIITSVSLFLLRTLVLGETVETAMNSARFHHQMMPNKLRVETFFNKTIAASLQQKGHQVVCYYPRSSVIQSVVRNDSYIYAVSDARKGGFADGY